MSFQAFMEKQIEAIIESGMEPDAWIEQNAEAFRAANPVTED